MINYYCVLNCRVVYNIVFRARVSFGVVDLVVLNILFNFLCVCFLFVVCVLFMMMFMLLLNCSFNGVCCGVYSIVVRVSKFGFTGVVKSLFNCV